MDITRRIAALAVAASMALGAVGCGGEREVEDDARAIPTTRAELRDEMRAAWIDHVAWKRLVLVSTAADLPDLPHANARLLRSQDALGALVARYEGRVVGDELTGLLGAHLAAEADVLAAWQRGDPSAEADARARWEASGRAIADLLVAVHPGLETSETRARLQRHLDLSLDEATARLAGDWEGDVAAADRVGLDAQDLADVLAEAVADEHLGAALPVASPADALRLRLHAAWSEHARWTRLALVSQVADLADDDVATGRLLSAEVDIGDALRPYYGDDVADRLTSLLEEHVVLGRLVVLESRAPWPLPGPSIAGPSVRTGWEVHGDAIADLLVEANPAWDRAAMRGMMRVLVDHTFTEATARIAGDHAADVAAHDALQRHVAAMADVLADGTIARFPDQLGR